MLNAAMQGSPFDMTWWVQFRRVRFRSGSGGTDVVWLRVNDGMGWGDWSSAQVDTPANHAPTTAGIGQSVARNSSIAAASLFSIDRKSVVEGQSVDLSQTAGNGN